MLLEALWPSEVYWALQSIPPGQPITVEEFRPRLEQRSKKPKSQVATPTHKTDDMESVLRQVEEGLQDVADQAKIEGMKGDL